MLQASELRIVISNQLASLLMNNWLKVCFKIQDPTKILVTSGPNPRILLNCCGIFDVLTFDPTTSNPMAAMAHYQQEDLIALGKIVLGNLF